LQPETFLFSNGCIAPIDALVRIWQLVNTNPQFHESALAITNWGGLKEVTDVLLVDEILLATTLRYKLGAANPIESLLEIPVLRCPGLGVPESLSY
jgi:hypothetical protein